MTSTRIIPWLALLALPTVASAEGTSTLGANQKLRSGVQLYVDIVDAGTETITWVGTGSVTVTSPSGASVGSLSNGQTFTPSSGTGAYGLLISSNQSSNTPWEVTVNNQTDSKGRLWSYTWRFNTGSFAPTHSTYASFYAVVPTGASNETGVIEMKLEGLSGYWYDVSSNGIGVNGENGGKSVPSSGNSVWAEHPMYLNPPTNSTYSQTSPQADGFWANGGGQTSVVDGSMTECDQFNPGTSGLAFYFETNVDATYNIICDTDGDGSFERTNSSDVLLIGRSEPGWNTVPWSGEDSYGNEVGVGTYNCQLQVNVGEYHYVGQDIETSYEGMRFFKVDGSGSRSGLRMYWDDSFVQGNVQNMPNGQVGLQSSGNAGIASGTYGTTTLANVNARSWGNFNSGGKGNQAYLDTYTFLASTVGATLTISAVDGLADSDSDGISDYEEVCWYGTDPNDDDTDDDGTPDGQQHGAGASSAGNGGLESNGRLHKALATRSIRRAYGGSMLKSNGIPSDLTTFIPAQGPGNSVRVDVSPWDLPEYTNADEVAGWDYIDPRGNVVGAVMGIRTTGALYEHTKAICDRSGGSKVTVVRPYSLGQGELIDATFVHEGDSTRDHGMTIVLYDLGSEEREGEMVDLGYLAASGWLLSDYPVPEADQEVLTLQVWASTPGTELEVAKGVLDSIGQTREVRWVESGAAPAAWMQSSTTSGGEIAIDVRNPLERGLSLSATITNEQGDTEIIDLGTATEGANDHALPPFLDAMVDLKDGDTVIDKVWLSDGVWVEMHDGLFGGATTVEFSGTRCAALNMDRDAAARDAGVPNHVSTHPLSGCASVRGQVDAYGGVARHIAGEPLDLTEQGSALFYLQSAGPVSFCIESTTTHSHACAPMDAEPEGAWIVLPLSELEAVGFDPRGAVDLVSVIGQPGALDLTVAGMSFTPWTPDDVVLAEAATPTPEQPAGVGCSQAALGGTWLMGLLALPLLRRRRD